jgi:hypothetical protein
VARGASSASVPADGVPSIVLVKDSRKASKGRSERPQFLFRGIFGLVLT